MCVQNFKIFETNGKMSFASYPHLVFEPVLPRIADLESVLELESVLVQRRLGGDRGEANARVVSEVEVGQVELDSFRLKSKTILET